MVLAPESEVSNDYLAAVRPFTERLVGQRKTDRMNEEIAMTYRGTVKNGVVVIDGEKPADGTVVEITPVPQEVKSLADLPAFGMWRDRTDLPQDSAEAAAELRRRAERRAHD
jgi:hypothetical protein